MNEMLYILYEYIAPMEINLFNLKESFNPKFVMIFYVILYNFVTAVDILVVIM